MSISSTGLSDWEFGPLVVKPKIAWKMLNCSNTHGYELLAAGELQSFLDGRSRKITVPGRKIHHPSALPRFPRVARATRNNAAWNCSAVCLWWA
jgi:hypothetical protein